MFLCDWQLFWWQHYQRQHIAETLNGTEVKKIWDAWVDWFGLRGEIAEVNPEIATMRDKAAQLRKRSKKR